ncbi:uncharacterized protein B0I36DRAFT_345520 [Microdochium trichocladiopsis]|uniref:Uncharacterized protein n=1 Tax=Microdochium trichocladiopsis TaxID=1682393 RepID=A0A9P8YB25_9PEZI|nr:uncharacterized protein B0I36DRAFT_345520 [Microdochium trichocladiopsis]KAH7037396.1 hypothetical protein B0I36DRAFT_345520 [Microdochium trichocladiopsis]
MDAALLENPVSSGGETRSGFRAEGGLGCGCFRYSLGAPPCVDDFALRGPWTQPKTDRSMDDGSRLFTCSGAVAGPRSRHKTTQGGPSAHCIAHQSEGDVLLNVSDVAFRPWGLLAPAATRASGSPRSTTLSRQGQTTCGPWLDSTSNNAPSQESRAMHMPQALAEASRPAWTAGQHKHPRQSCLAEDGLGLLGTFILPAVSLATGRVLPPCEQDAGARLQGGLWGRRLSAFAMSNNKRLSVALGSR